MYTVVFEPKKHLDPEPDVIPPIDTLAALNLLCRVIAPRTSIMTRFSSSDVANYILALALASPLALLLHLLCQLLPCLH